MVVLAAVLIYGILAAPVAQRGSASNQPGTAASPSVLGGSAPTRSPGQGTATATDFGSLFEPTPLPTGTQGTANPIAGASPACTPTDQDQYVYHPYRLAVQAACIRVTGVIQAVRMEADGDFHMLLALDPAYSYLLTPANQGVERGDLVVEPVCVRPVTQPNAISICASDRDPLPPPYPVVGQRVWMEGRYVFDRAHGGWAELHPLYRWGIN